MCLREELACSHFHATAFMRAPASPMATKKMVKTIAKKNKMRERPLATRTQGTAARLRAYVPVYMHMRSPHAIASFAMSMLALAGAARPPPRACAFAWHARSLVHPLGTRLLRDIGWLLL